MKGKVKGLSRTGFKGIKKSKFIPGKSRIKYAEFTFNEEEIQASIEALISSFSNNWFALGINTKKFQNKLSSYLGLKKTIFVNSGSSANLISIATLFSKKKIRRGDEAITIATTFPTSINPILIYGLQPVIVDVELPSYTVNISQLERAITKKTKLIFLPHINGSPHDMKRVMEIARKHEIFVIEDCCDAFGSKYDGKMVGTFGDLGSFSFYAAHHMSTGEGGAIGSNDEELIATAESLRDWGRMPIKSTKENVKRKLTFQKISSKLPHDYEERYTYSNIGFNLKPLDMQAAIGLVQLEKINQFSAIRKRNFRFLFENFLEFDDKIILPSSLPKSDPSWFVFPITIRKNSGFNRKEIVQFLEKKKIETRPMLGGNIIDHPAYSDIKFHKIGSLSVSHNIMKNSFVIGVHQSLSLKQLEYVIECFRRFFRKIN